jgi:TetR/AcrR family transcriptional regulator
VVAHQLVRIHRAVIEVVAENGYENLRVRDVVRHAEVSTRAFYELFGSKEDCFIHSYDRLARQASRRMIAAQTGEPDWRKRVGLIFDEFARQVEQDPRAARLALIDIYRAGQVCSEHAWRAERTFEAVLAECLVRAPKGVAVPALIIEAVSAGITGVARTYLASDRPASLPDSRDELVEWALRYVDRSANELADLDSGSVWRDTTLESSSVSSNGVEGPSSNSRGDRALILKRTVQLAGEGGYAKLTVERIRTAAHLSRKEFHAHFNDVEACYIAALEQRAGEALAQAARAQVAAHTWSGGVYRAIAAYCAYVVSDPLLERVLAVGDFPPGAAGSRSRQRMTHAMADQLLEGVPRSARSTRLEFEASAHAAWSLFHRNLLGGASSHRSISATLAYLFLAPAIGPGAALEAIAKEQ